MRVQTKATGLLLFLITSACLALVACRPAEPTYKGKDLSYWIDLNRHLDQHGTVYGQQELDLNEAHAAITAIGTNGLPYLIKWMRYQPLWGTRFIPRLPRPLQHQPYRFNQDHADQARASMQALELLGTNAVSAIPELAALAMKTNILDRDIAGRATSILFHLGPQAYPALMNVWSNAGAGQQKKNPFLYWEIRNLLTNTPAQ